MQNQYKILFISAFPPSEKTAGQNYTRLLLEDLANRGHIIDIVFFQYGDHEYKPQHPGIHILANRPLGAGRKLMNIFKMPFLHPFFTSRLSLRLIWFLLRNSNRYNLIYLDFSQVFLYGLFAPRSLQYLMLHDIIYQKYARKSGILQALTRKWVLFSEGLMLAGKRKTLLTFSEKDKALVKAYYDKDTYVVTPFLSPLIQQLKEADFVESGYFCFYGAWNRSENLEGMKWFLDNVYPRLSVRLPFKIIGGGMSKKEKDMYSTIPGVELLGFVDNPYSILAGAKALIAPLFQGAGVKFKVLEALACGTTVIGTEIALEGIASELAQGLIRCDTEQDFAREIDNLTLSSRTMKEKIALHQKTVSVYTQNRFSEIL